MTAHTDALTPHVEDDSAAHGHAERGINTALLGMLLFIGSEIMFFAGLFGAYFNVAASAPEWPPANTDFINPIPLPTFVTIILVISSITMQLAVNAIKRGDRRAMNRALTVSLLLGVFFLFLQVYDYWELITHHSFGINTGVYGTLFYSLTGFHGAHVFGGVVGITVVLLRGMQGQFSARHHVAVEAVSIYWHFVDVVWIALFFTIYVLR